MKEHDSIALLAHITDETLRSVSGEKIVLPSDYAGVFQQKIAAHPQEIHFTNETMVDKLSEATLKQARFMMESAEMHLDTLSECATDVHKAIMIEDKEKIGSVLKTVIQLRKEIDHLRQEVYKDALTKIYNRKWIYDHVLDADRVFQKEGVMAFIDVNDFKHINDTHGHHIGDRVLFHIAQTLKSEMALCLPSAAAKVARYAGDEFMVFAFKEDFDLDALLGKIQTKLLSTKFKAEEKLFTLSFSFGCVRFACNDDFTCKLNEADAKMYENKAYIKGLKK